MANRQNDLLAIVTAEWLISGTSLTLPISENNLHFLTQASWGQKKILDLKMNLKPGESVTPGFFKHTHKSNE